MSDTLTWKGWVVGDPEPPPTATTKFTDLLPGDTATFEIFTVPVNSPQSTFVLEGLHTFDQPHYFTGWQATIGGGYTTLGISIHGAWTAAYSPDGSTWTDIQTGTAAYNQNGTAWLLRSGIAGVMAEQVRLRIFTSRPISQNPTAFIGDFRVSAFPPTAMAAIGALIFGALADATATAIETPCDCCTPSYMAGAPPSMFSFGGGGGVCAAPSVNGGAAGCSFLFNDGQQQECICAPATATPTAPPYVPGITSYLSSIGDFVLGGAIGRPILTETLYITAALEAWRNAGIVLVGDERVGISVTGPVVFANEPGTGGLWYAYPEGAYPSPAGSTAIFPTGGFPIHAGPMDTAAVYQTQVVNLIASNLKSFSFALAAYPDAGGMPTLTGYNSAFQTNRQSTYTAGTFAAGDRLWLIYNDQNTRFGVDNTGYFTATITVYPPGT